MSARLLIATMVAAHSIATVSPPSKAVGIWPMISEEILKKIERVIPPGSKQQISCGESRAEFQSSEMAFQSNGTVFQSNETVFEKNETVFDLLIEEAGNCKRSLLQLSHLGFGPVTATPWGFSTTFVVHDSRLDNGSEVNNLAELIGKKCEMRQMLIGRDLDENEEPIGDWLEMVVDCGENWLSPNVTMPLNADAMHAERTAGSATSDAPMRTLSTIVSYVLATFAMTLCAH